MKIICLSGFSCFLLRYFQLSCWVFVVQIYISIFSKQLCVVTSLVIGEMHCWSLGVCISKWVFQNFVVEHGLFTAKLSLNDFGPCFFWVVPYPKQAWYLKIQGAFSTFTSILRFFQHPELEQRPGEWAETALRGVWHVTLEWWKFDSNSNPKCSMGLVYFPTQLGSFGGKCRKIYHTLSIWERIRDTSFKGWTSSNYRAREGSRSVFQSHHGLQGRFWLTSVFIFGPTILRHRHRFFFWGGGGFWTTFEMEDSLTFCHFNILQTCVTK